MHLQRTIVRRLYRHDGLPRSAGRSPQAMGAIVACQGSTPWPVIPSLTTKGCAMILRSPFLSSLVPPRACPAYSNKQVSHDDENPRLCGEPTDWPYPDGAEGVGGNIKQAGDDEHPGPDGRQR